MIGIDLKMGVISNFKYLEVGKQKLFCFNLLGVCSWNYGVYNLKIMLWYLSGMEVCNMVISVKQEEFGVISGFLLGFLEIMLFNFLGKKVDGYFVVFELIIG